MAFTDMQRFGTGVGAGNILAGIGGLLNRPKNPATAANQYISQIPGQTKGYYQPFFEAGTRAVPKLENEYSSLLSNPGGRINEIGRGFHESPGFQFALKQALQGASHAAAAGGMAGSPEHHQRAMQLGTDLGNQEFYKWLAPTLGLYESGLHGTEGLAGRGQQAGSQLADMIAQALAQQGQYEYEGQAGRNEANNSLFSNLGSGIGTLAAFLPFI